MAASREQAPCSLYFCGSVCGSVCGGRGREDQALYAQIISWLRHCGKVITEHVADAELEPHGEEAAGTWPGLAWLQQADVVVAEVTLPSLGVGYELGRAVALGKPILCLFRPQSGQVLSAMIRGAADDWRVPVWDYTEGEMETMLDGCFEAYLP